LQTVTSVLLLSSVCAAPLAAQQPRPRARDLGVPFDGTPGPFNAITDVAGITVGHSTIIRRQGKLVVGGWFTLNGNGEMTGTTLRKYNRLVESRP
jgi:hypothetical protein